MPRAQRVYIAACAFATAFALVYVGVDYGKVPHPVYDPLAHAWHLLGRASGVPMGYYGLWLYALIAAAVVAGVAWFVTARRAQPAREKTLALLAAWTGTAWALAAGYFAWMNWP